MGNWQSKLPWFWAVLYISTAWAQQLAPSQWNAGGALSAARGGPAGAIVPSGSKAGMFAVVGGFNSSGSPMANVDLIDASGNVAAGPSLNQARGHAGMAA